MSNAYADCCSEIWLSSFYAFRVYFPFLIITKSFAISRWRSCFDFLWLIPRSSEISFEVTVMLSVMYEITASCLSVSISGRFCKIWVLVDLLSGTNESFRVMLSGLKLSSMTGRTSLWLFQTEKILEIPNPSLLPIPIKLNIRIIAVFLGSDIPPALAASS